MRFNNFIFIFIGLLLTCCQGRPKLEGTDFIDITDKLTSNKSSWTSLKNGERIDGYTRLDDSIFGGEIACNVNSLKDIDIETFKVLPGTDYAKDKNHVYYPLATLCIDYTDCGVCFYSEIIVDNCDPLTFQYLGSDYAKDSNNVFFRGQQIKGADSGSFNVIDGPEFFYFAVDKSHVYMHDNIFKEANSLSFYFDKSDPRNINSGGIQKFIIGDKTKEWEYVPPSTINEIEKR